MFYTLYVTNGCWTSCLRVSRWSCRRTSRVWRSPSVMRRSTGKTRRSCSRAWTGGWLVGTGYSICVTLTQVCVSLAIDVSTTRMSDHLKWRLVQQNDGNYLTPLCTMSFWAIRRLNLLYFAGYLHMQCLTQHAFLHLSKHLMSIQAFCQYDITD